MHGDICPYRLLYIKDGVRWKAFTTLWDLVVHDRCSKNLRKLWAFWSNEDKFLEPNLYFLYALHGRGNPFGKECLACLWQPAAIDQKVKDYRDDA